MRVTLIGHASTLVEMSGATCLMDPVFFDPFEEGAVVSCPSRMVDCERIPHVDILIVSHRHPDHFDLASLDRVNRACQVVCPADPLIIYGLRKLGFERIQAVEPMGEISATDFELYPTRSESEVREFGMVFRDSSGVFFNQVDTFLSRSTIEAILARFGRPDLMFAMYASQNFEFFHNRTVAFPYETHRQNLANTVRMHPRMVAPGSAGFRFCGDHAWLNSFLFPISPERFAADLGRLEPTIEVRMMRPGDVFEIEAACVRHLKGASALARMTRDDHRLIEFDPTAPIPPLTDPNPDSQPVAQLEELTHRFLSEQMGGFALGEQGLNDPVVQLYRKHRVRYAVGLVLPGPADRWYRFDFASARSRVDDQEGFTNEADIVHRIAASALAGWIGRRRSFFYVRAYSRRFTTLYGLGYTDDQLRLEPLALPDLLMHYILQVAPGSESAARQRIDLEVEALGRSGRGLHDL